MILKLFKDPKFLLLYELESRVGEIFREFDSGSCF